MATEQRRLTGLARTLGFFSGAILLGVYVCNRTALAQCGPTGPTSAKNTACGTGALISNTTGAGDSAFGYNALDFNTTGGDNTASGVEALAYNTTGGSNIGLGYYAGSNIVAGSYNIDIGGAGTVDESNTIRIGFQGAQTATYIAGIDGTGVSSTNLVCVLSSGQLGVCSSSARYKRDIRDMGAASSGLLKLRPVVFRYRSDAKSQRQYGLIAEEVARVYPELVDYDRDGKPLTVRYLELNAMLLNGLQKQASQLQTQIHQLETQASQLQTQVRETQELAQRLQTKDRQLAAQQREIDALKQKDASINALSQRLTALERQVQTSTSQGLRSLASK
jgi:Chaperone of endosialidase